MRTRDITILTIIGLLALSLTLLRVPHPKAVSQTATTSISTSSIVAPLAPSLHSSATKQGENAPMVHPASKTPLPTPTTTEHSESRPKVHMTIVEPDGKSDFDVDLMSGDDLCDNLKEAQSEGDIKSLTIDDTYLSSFGSLYVREINGYSNNWTVEVNGTKPEGCSLYKPKEGDQIIWRFGV